MPVRLFIGSLALGLAVTGAIVSTPVSAAAGPPPPGDRGARSTWTEADKTGFGTARTRGSNVWFTLQGGRTSEVFYPDLSTPSVRSLQLTVTDLARSFVDRPARDMTTTVSRPDARSLRFTQVHVADSGRYRLVEEHVTDPRRDAYVVRVRLVSLDGGAYRVRVQYDPALDNSGMDDRGRRTGRALVATDGRVSTALVARPGLADLKPGGDRPHNLRQSATIRGLNGRAGHRTATLSLGFGEQPARALRVATRARTAGWTRSAASYDRGWHRYVGSLRGVPASAAAVRTEYLASTLVLAAAEDKLNPGAFVASPSAPWAWGNELKDLSSPSDAYHLVWSRDAYEFGTALWAAGDERAARRIVDWLFEVQQRPDGSFPQNSDVSGTPAWEELQLDEVALPIVLARLTGRTGPATYRGVKKAANFIAGFKDEETGHRAPFSPQERWENQSGYSPNSIAAQVAGLVSAADIARRNDDRRAARRWLRLADRWEGRLQAWTVTTTGPLSAAPYYLRITKDGNPDAGTTYAIGDGGPSAVDQRRVVDPSFLTLVRWGIEAPDDPTILNSLAVVDQDLRVETPNGSFWHRFSFDGYGETRTGGEWTTSEDDTFQTLGRAWPLLTGERGEYAVAAGQDGTPYLAAMAAAAGPSGLIAEQLWDGREPTGRACCPAGENTRAATPLTWSHAGLVRLAWTIQRGRPADRMGLVDDRYPR
ncbi:glycoside hydrolase family 15 protein [Nocardioides sp. LHG3406-4]|uniref:glycoside hydrolase family 15 protein n=1 Tax=Nocardioides sp. LHG3406-4 TaxID=2804575 RepID=UPI003CFA4D05